MQLSPEAHAAFSKHAASEWPRECVGFIVNETYIPIPNSSPDPSKSFLIDPVHWVKASLMGPVQAIVHSHPYDKTAMPMWPAEWPSTADMKQWMRGTTPWGIAACDGEGISQLVWLDEANPEPLEGREFIHGINDCYSLIRDWFRLNKQVTIPNFARGIEWWLRGEDLYSGNFQKAGFIEINPEDAVIGDCLMMKVASPVINHAAVITGNNEILHHLIKRLSGYDSMHKWSRFIVKTVRYTGEQSA